MHAKYIINCNREILKINENTISFNLWHGTFLKNLENMSIKKVKDCKLSATRVITKLDTLSPLKTLSRGYCMTESEGKVITNASDLKKDMKINLKFYDGDVKAKVL